MIEQIIIFKQWQRTRAELEEFLFKAKHLDSKLHTELEEALGLVIIHVDNKLKRGA